MTQARALPDGALVVFYGDDFTGSSAAMEVLAFAGLDTVLFIDAPTPERLARFSGYRGIGIAGIARSRSPEWMEKHLPPIFGLLSEVRAPVVHYKVCSTFDSAPHIGNLGKATEIARRRYPGWTPMVVSDPGMGRFQAFGNLFAYANGIGYRLDRHPTMSVHPVTPMDEADLVRHLARLTELKVGLVDFVTMKRGGADILLAREVANGASIVSLDVLDKETLEEAGRLIWEHGEEFQFTLGSQGIEQALVAYWRSRGLIPPAGAIAKVAPVDRIAVVSGSVSPITAAQIRHAEAAGFELIRFDATKAVFQADLAAEMARLTEASLVSLRNGRSPLIYSAAGPQDEAVTKFRAAVSGSGESIALINDRLGASLGDLLKVLVQKEGLRRVVVSGGDTSGHAISRLGIDALTAIAPLSPGAPLCRAHSPDRTIEGLEIALKGGQTGAPDFFTVVRDGGRQD